MCIFALAKHKYLKTMNYGFVRTAAAVPTLKVADCKYNVQEIESLIAQAEGKGVEIICFPELCLTGYTCGDLFAQQVLLDEAEMALISLMNFCRSLDIIAIVGLPVACRGTLLNCAAVVQKGKILGLVPKTFLPNHKEFSEQRWFTPGCDLPDTTVLICGQQVKVSRNLLFHTLSCCFGVEVGTDASAPLPLSSALALKGGEIIFNPSADSAGAGKMAYLKTLLSQQSARSLSGYVYAGCGHGESTQDMVFYGKSLIYENGEQLAEGKPFCRQGQLLISEIDVERLRTERRVNTLFAATAAHSLAEEAQHVDTEFLSPKEFTLSRSINPSPFVPQGNALDERCEEIFAIQIEGLAKRLIHTHCQTAIIGISGGLDSTLALLVCAHTFDSLGLPRKNIVGITMPGFGTSNRTYTNALELMRALGITIREISIKDACLQHFRDLGIDPERHDVTYENSQARERTQILMDAANQMNGMVIGTGDLSELALGWATYNGDHMSMYGVNASVPKTLMQNLVIWVAGKMDDAIVRATLLDIVDTPISPELLPAEEDGSISQRTEDKVGPYELHDFFLYYVLRWGFRPSKIFFLAQTAFAQKYTDEVLKKWLTTFYRRFFAQQFKRSCLPDGPKVGSCSLSPRGDWHMPSDASAAAWLAECETL